MQIDKKSRRAIGVTIWALVATAFVAGLWNARRIDAKKNDERAAQLATMGDRELAEQSLLESGNYGRAILDYKGRVMEWNKALEKWTGYSKGELLGKTILDVIPTEMRQSHEEAFAKAVADPNSSKKVQVVSCKLVPKDPAKKPIPVRVTVLVVRPPIPDQPPYVIANIYRQSSVIEMDEPAEQTAEAKR